MSNKKNNRESKCFRRSGLDGCGCCEILDDGFHETENPPGLSSLKYRIGTYETFKNNIISMLSSDKILQTALGNLTTRANDDLAIAIIDSWAVAADVFTFYNERILNEAFLRTATERMSVLELARSIGYKLSEGVSANTFLVFTLEEALGSVEKSVIDVGTKVQSLPEQGQIPQIFETTERIEAMREFNSLKPRSTALQKIDENTTTFYFRGLSAQLSPGDGILVVIKGEDESIISKSFKTISKVDTDLTTQTIRVEVLSNQDQVNAELVSSSQAPLVVQAERIDLDQLPDAIDLNKVDNTIINEMVSKLWTLSDYAAFSVKYNIKLNDLFVLLNYRGPKLSGPRKASVYSFKLRTGLYGHNAPRYDSSNYPPAIYGKWYEDVPVNKKPSLLGETINAPDPDWYEYEFYDEGNGKLIYLDKICPSILPGQWVSLLQTPAPDTDEPRSKSYQVKEVREKTVKEFGLNNRVTGLLLETESAEELSEFMLIKTTLFGQSEELELAELPIEGFVEGNYIDLDHKVNGLKVGQVLAISGKTITDDLSESGLTSTEISIISKVETVDNVSARITFQDPLKNRFKLNSVTIYANVAPATHGEGREEILGGGDPSQPLQQFLLKLTPLTYVSSPTGNGAKSSVELFVNNIRWTEVPYLFGATSREKCYELQTDRDDNYDGNRHTRIIFGDGINGQRPEAGVDNIKAKYRVGTGSAGMLKKDQISLLTTRPLGVKAVTNAVAPTGAEDPEDLAHARISAPITVLTFNRIVSPDDFENFAKAFRGIGKAIANWVWDGEKKVVHLTVSSSSGNDHSVDKNSTLYKNLVSAIKHAKDPTILFEIESVHQISFSVLGKVTISSDRNPDIMLTTIKNTLNSHFSFESRDFGLSVTVGEISAVIQRIDGVESVDIDNLSFSEDISTLSSQLPKAILIINPAGIDFIVEVASAI